MFRAPFKITRTCEKNRYECTGVSNQRCSYKSKMYDIMYYKMNNFLLTEFLDISLSPQMQERFSQHIT